MNERQKKIMIPYQEPTDTCPDCSDIPCHCGLPAGYTPTPRTDNSGRYCSHQRRERWIKTVPLKTSEELERELAAVTEQRDQYKAALQSADNHNHEIATKLEIVTEQRDRLAGGLKWIAGWNHQLFDENTAMQMRDKAEQALRSLTQDHTVDANDMIATVKRGADES